MKNTLKKITLVVLLICINGHTSIARNGMWIPTLLKQLNETDLKTMGLQIPVEELFNSDSTGINHAIVQFGGGCTGEIVSDRGLLITNHHCGFGQIQSLSSIENNYLENGYWAKTDADELPCPGLSVTFIREIMDVTAAVNARLSASINESERDKLIKNSTDSLEKIHSRSTTSKAIVKSFFGGNQFYLFITETYKDVRFVGAPPSSVGNFGGETDNWVWPRHTGDFSLFRIYAGKDNQPAEYAKENTPYQPIRSFVIDASGVNEGDFTMVYGFPGRTQQFLTSSAIDLIEHQTNTTRIALRDIRLNIWREAMLENDTIDLQYASKFRTLANAYKKWKGELLGLKSEQVLSKRQDFEKLHTKDCIGETAGAVNAAIDSSKTLSRMNDFYTEGFYGIELIALAARFKTLSDLCRATSPDEKKITQAADKMLDEIPGFYKNYDTDVDLQVALAMLDFCSKEIPTEFLPEFMTIYRKSPEKFVNNLYKKSPLRSEKTARQLLTGFNAKKFIQLYSDPAWQIAFQLNELKSARIDKPLTRLNEEITRLQRNYISCQLQVRTTEMMAPDANSTLRLAYGKVEGITPKDGVRYHWMTTGDGILQKSAQDNIDYALDPALKKLLEVRSFGRYALNDTLPVAFIASNHTTGGNSGSPVLNNKGELIGVNFDRIWEGVMSDLYFNPSLSRNVAVDIRYVLFIIDRLGNDGRLLEEMKIRWD